MCRRALFVSAGAGALLGLSGSAPSPAMARAARPDLVVSSVMALPAAAASGTVLLHVTVRNAGRARAGRSRLRLSVAAVGSKMPGLRLRRLTSVAGLGSGRSVRLRAAGALPVVVPAGVRIRVSACADGAKRVREANERNNCRATGPIKVTAATTEALTAALVAAGRLSRGKAALYTMQAVTGDRRLPAEFRTKGGNADDHSAIADVASAMKSFSPSVRARLAPYFLPPRIRAVLAGSGPRGAHASAAGCATNPGRPEYKSVPAVGGKVKVWYPTTPQFGFNYHFGVEAGRQAALRIANDIDVSWPKLTGQFRVPRSDANIPCLNHGDGSFDVEVVALSHDYGQTVPYGLFAIPFELSRLQTFCTGTPSFMMLRPDADRWTVAHELMHAIQFAYKYKSCGGTQNSWWDEGGATWAGDFVYPTEHPREGGDLRFRGAFTNPDQPLWTTSYDAWPFWFFLTQTTGVRTMNKIFAGLQEQTVRPAVNGAIPGGYAQQLPSFGRYLWNRSPDGQSGFPVARSFRDWHGPGQGATSIGDTAFGLDGAPERSLAMPVLAPGSGHFFTPSDRNPWSRGDAVGGHLVVNTLGPEAASFRHLSFPDRNLRQITFKNGLYGKPGERIDAWMRLADGTWKVADWSAKQTVLCRDTPAENVQELYVVSENTGVTGDGIPIYGVRHQLVGKSVCPRAPRISGTFSGDTDLSTGPGAVPWRLSWTGDVVATLSPNASPYATYYALSGGHVNVTFTGTGDCDLHGSGTFDLVAANFGAASPVVTVRDGEAPTYSVGLTAPGAQVTITKSNCTSPEQNGQQVGYPLTSTQLSFDDSGRKVPSPPVYSGTGTGRGADPSGPVYHWTWDLRPG